MMVLAIPLGKNSRNVSIMCTMGLFTRLYALAIAGMVTLGVIAPAADRYLVRYSENFNFARKGKTACLATSTG